MNIKHSIIIGFTALSLTTSSITGCAWLEKDALTDLSKDLSPVGACLLSALIDGAITDPITLVSSCIGATLTALDNLITQLLAAEFPPSDAGTTAARITPFAAKLLGIQVHTRALLAVGVK
jgi:hypothetical protein